MKNPDLNLLPIAFALYDELSVSRGARLLGMSQPAVSMALRRMREAFDDPLYAVATEFAGTLPQQLAIAQPPYDIRAARGGLSSRILVIFIELREGLCESSYVRTRQARAGPPHPGPARPQP